MIGELHTLLKRFGLETLLTRLEQSGGEDHMETRVIIEAYVETRDPDFYDLYYRSTYPLCMEWVKSHPKYSKTGIGPEEILDEAYTVFLSVLRDNGLSQWQSPIVLMKGIMQKLILSNSAGHQDEYKPAGLSTSDAAEKRNSFDLIIAMEEDHRESLQNGVIQEFLLDPRTGLTDEERDVFTDFYIHKKSTESIALQKSSSIYNINKMLYEVKSKIKALTQLLISLGNGEEEE